MLHAVVAHIRKLHRHLSGAVARQGGAIRCDCQKDAAPAVHTGFRAFLVVIRRHENQLARVAFGFELGAVFIGDAFGAYQLFLCRQQAHTIELRPAVELAGGELDEVCLQGNAQFDNAVDLVDIVPMGDEVQHHRIAVRFHRAGHFQLLREGFFRAGEQVVHLFIAGLEADLDVVQARLLKSLIFCSVRPIPEVIRLV